MAERHVNVQDVFLNHVRKNRTSLTVFLINGVKLQGAITWFDAHTILLKRDGLSQLIYKHAISAIMPNGTVQLFEQHSHHEHEEEADLHTSNEVYN